MSGPTLNSKNQSWRQKFVRWARRRRRRWGLKLARRRRRHHVVPGEVSSQPASSSVPASRLTRARLAWRRFSLPRFILKTAVVLAATLASVLILAYLGIALFLKGDDIRRLVIDSVEQQTGAKLAIAACDFDINTGVTFQGLALYPPKLGEPLGYRQGGSVYETPLLKAEALKIHYDLPSLFLARVHLKAVQLVRPHIELVSEDGQFNFAGIQAFRAKHFPPAAAPEPTPPPAEGDPNFQLPSFIPVHPRHLYSPIRIALNNIGLSELSVHVSQQSASKGSLDLVASPLNLDLGVQWRGLDSKIHLKLASGDASPLAVSVKKAADATSPLVPFAELSTKLAIELALINLSTLKLSLGNELASLRSKALNLEDFDTSFALVVSLFDDLKGLHLERINLKLAELFEYGLSGSIAVPAGNFERIHLDLNQNFTADLDALLPLVRPFQAQLDLGGHIQLSEFSVRGDIEPKKLQQDPKAAPLPLISGKLLLAGLRIADPSQGLNVSELNGKTTLSITPNLSAQGSQIDTHVDLSLGKAELKKDGPLGQLHLQLEDLAARLLTRVTFPDISAPVVKLNAEAPHIRVDKDGKTLVDAPLYVDADAEYDPLPQLMSATLRSELGELASFNLMADCQQNCQRLRSHSQVNLNALDKLLVIADPIARQLGKGDLLPTKLAGTVAWQFDLKGQLPPLAKLNKQTFLEQAALQYATQLNLDRIGLEMPMMMTKLKNFETRLSLRGDLTQQALRLNQSFEELSLQLPATATAAALPLSINRLAFETNIANKTPKLSDDLPTLAAQLATEVASNLHIGRVQVPGKLPQPIDDFSFGVEVSQQALRDLTIEKLKVSLPAFGLNFLADLSTSFSPNLLSARLPAQIKGNLALGIQHGGGERLPGGIETSGKVALETHFSSSNMQEAYVEGQTSFDHFNLKVNRLKDNKNEELIAVEDMVGKIPFKQTIPIGQFLKPAGASPATSPTPAATAPASLPGKTELSRSIADYWQKNADTLTKSTNAMSLADYPSIRPFYPGKKPVHIKTVRAAKLTMNEIECDVELRQNWFSLNQFMMDFLGGKVHGSFQVAFDPMVHSLKTSLHLTRLNSHKLLDNFPHLRKKQGAGLTSSDPYIDATVHWNYDLRQNDMVGGIDITSIGKEQLKMILYFVDPHEKDPTIENIRSLLGAGDVEAVAIPIKNGEIDIDVRLKLLGIPLPVPKIHRFPVAKILDNLMGKPKKADDPKASQTAMAPASPSKA